MSITLLYTVSALILLGLCIFVHELGHLLGGVVVGIKARTFSIGYGKGFIKKKWGDTTYQLTLIPFGGYCSFYGDNPSEELKGESYEFLSAAPWRRIVTVVAGPLFNLIFGIILFFVMNLVGFEIETNKIMIPEQFKSGEFEAPAFDAGLQSGDVVTAIGEKKVSSFMDIQEAVAFSNGETLNFEIDRSGEALSFSITPVRYSEGGYYSIGVMPYGTNVIIAEVLPGGAAAESGLQAFDEVSAIDGLALQGSQDFVDRLRLSANKKITLRVKRKSKLLDISLTPRTKEVLHVTGFKSPQFADETYDFTADRIDLIKEAVNEGSVSVNGVVPASFEEFVNMLDSKEQVTITSKGGEYSGSIKHESYGFIGVSTMLAPEMKDVRYGLGGALVKSVTDPFDFIAMNLRGMGMIFSGKIDARENVSGPVRIAKIAGDTMRYRGIRDYVLLMARISIILMIMNLLPIPAVDGSHILFYTIEALRGKPLPASILEKVQMAGFFILVGLGILVLFNDISQLKLF